MSSQIYRRTKGTMQCDLNSKGAIHILHRISNMKIRGIDHQHFGVSSSPTFPMSENSTVKRLVISASRRDASNICPSSIIILPAYPRPLNCGSQNTLPMPWLITSSTLRPGSAIKAFFLMVSQLASILRGLEGGVELSTRTQKDRFPLQVRGWLPRNCSRRR